MKPCVSSGRGVLFENWRPSAITSLSTTPLLPRVSCGQFKGRTLRLLTQNAFMGRRGEIEGNRELVLADLGYIVAYRVLDDRVEVFFVQHGARLARTALARQPQQFPRRRLVRDQRITPNPPDRGADGLGAMCAA